MPIQNYSNHQRMVPLYHYYSAALLLAIFIGSLVNLYHCSKENVYSASLIVALTVLVGLVAYFARAFALKAQDRAIRAEENFRYFVLTGRPLPEMLRMSQIIALRFASDEEFVALVERTVAEHLRSKTIKELVVNWRSDHNRV